MKNYLSQLLLLCLVFLGACDVASKPIPRQELTPDVAMHLLRSTVRVTAGHATGTGVAVFSQKRQNSLDPRYFTYILTCAHVVDDTCCHPIQIETFHYLDDNAIVAAASFHAELVLINNELDIAVLQVTSPKPFQDVAIISDPKNFYNHQIYNSVYVVGCALGKLPYITNGNIASYQAEHIVDGQEILDSLRISSPTIYGNSGGGVYSSDGSLLGIAQAIDLVHGTFYEHSAYAVPIWKIALYLKEYHLGFIIGCDTSNIDNFLVYREKRGILEKQEVDEKSFRRSLLDALEKMNSKAPITSITINISPIATTTNKKVWR